MTDATGLTIGDVAELLEVSISTVRVWTDDGKLHCERNVAGHRRYDPDAIRQFQAKVKGR